MSVSELLSATSFSTITDDSISNVPTTFFVLVLEKDVNAITDRGRDIPLFHYDAIALPTQPGPGGFHPQPERHAFLDHLEQKFVARIKQGNGQIVRLLKPNPGSNCHGWVFTGGRFGIQDPHVPSILKENGYVPVQDPQIDDIAIYRAEGGIRHSGFVRRSPTGAILVESKWGPFGVLLHAPEAHPGERTFYRSTRAGHMLKLAPIER